MSIASLAPDYIRAIMAYQPGKPISELAREMGIAEASIVKLASNENPLGMSTRAREAAVAAVGDVARYPDGGAFALKAALCRKFGVRPEQLIVGNGSNDILELVAQAFLAPGLSAIYSRHAFAVYPLATNARGARGIEVAAKNFGHDLDAMLAAIEVQTRVIFIANPNNPTGTFLPGAALEDFLARVPSTDCSNRWRAMASTLPSCSRVRRAPACGNTCSTPTSTATARTRRLRPRCRNSTNVRPS